MQPDIDPTAPGPAYLRGIATRSASRRKTGSRRRNITFSIPERFYLHLLDAGVAPGRVARDCVMDLPTALGVDATQPHPDEHWGHVELSTGRRAVTWKEAYAEGMEMTPHSGVKHVRGS